MKICIFSIYDKPYEEIAQQTIFKNFKDYCILNGYDLKYFEITPPKGLATAWFKIKCSKDLLDNFDYDYIFFVDADCLFLNTLHRVEDYIDPNFFMICSEEINKHDQPEIISSHLLIKNCDKSKKYLQEVLKRAEDPSFENRDVHPWEQVAVNEVAKREEFKNEIKILKQKSLNIFWPQNQANILKVSNSCNDFCYKVGDFIAHFAGYPLDERKRLIETARNSLQGGYLTEWKCYMEGDIHVVYFVALKSFHNVDIKYYDLKSKELLHERHYDFMQKAFFHTNNFKEKPFDTAVVECYSEGELIAKNLLQCK